MLLKTNSCYFVGELVEVKNLRTGTFNKKDASGKEISDNFVSADIVIKSVIDGQEITNELRNFTAEHTLKGTVNANFKTISNIQSMLNKKVAISGASLRGTRFWSAKNNSLVPSVKYNFNIIRLARVGEADASSFTFGGFVVKPLAEHNDADGNLDYYQLTMAQATYREDNMQLIDFIVDKDNIKAKSTIESRYPVGTTVEVSGICRNIVTNVTKTEEVAFGDPITRVLPKSDKHLVITSGKEPVVGEGEYGIDAIKALKEAYNKEAEEIKNKALDESATNGGAAIKNDTADKAPSKKSALEGLI
jgi:hypothetical protein